jgi:3-methyl-2-oxobutanoate hydroxymethyltransferase
VNVFGGYKLQARDTESAVTLVEDCLALEAAGAFAVVLELVPAEIAALVTEELEIPTIGIGAGAGCDGQVQVFHDLLGLGAFTPRHARQYVDTGAVIREALGAYADDVRSGAFPAEENLTHLAEEVLGELETALPPTAGDDA